MQRRREAPFFLASFGRTSHKQAIGAAALVGHTRLERQRIFKGGNMVRGLGLRVAACLFLSLQIAAPVRAESPERFAGLHEAATISIDAEGIAHVRANNEHDLYFLQGWTHARERLFQMDYHRRLASGTLAELLGLGPNNQVLATDVQLRTLGLRRAAQRSHGAASERMRDALQAYAEGVNAWVARNRLPIEYGALELTKFVPWDPVDSLAIGKLIAWDNAFDLDTVPTLAFLSYKAAFGEARANALFFLDLWRSASIEPELATVPNAQEGGTAFLEVQSGAQEQSLNVSEESKKLMRDYVERVQKLPAFRGILSREARGGSNIWAISGRLTRDGRPLVANDPHVGLGTPTLFYPMGLELGEEPVFGGSIAGAPGIVHGYNRYIAWGSTNNRVDVTDFFTEQVVPLSPTSFATLHKGALEPVTVIPESYRINKIGNGVPDDFANPPPGSVPAATLVMPRRDDGPIVSLDLSTGKALSVQYVGFGPTQELEAFLMINRARTLEEFKDALQRFDSGSQNFAYADAEGNIAYFTAGEVPVREDLQGYTVGAPWFVRNGQGGNEWLTVQNPQPHQATPREILRFEEMPHIVNPPAGFFVNANHDPLGHTSDNNPLNQLRPSGGIFYLAYSWNSGFRAARIHARLRELLETGDQRISFEEMQAVQSDNILHDAVVLKPYIVAAFDRALTSAVPQLADLAKNPGVAAALARLRAWNGSTPTHSVEASIYAAWRSRMIDRVIDTPLGVLPKPDEQDSVTALRFMLDKFAAMGGIGVSGIDFFAAPGISSPEDRRDFALLASVQSGLELLARLFGGSTNQGDYQWGALQKVALNHPLGAPFSIPPIPTDGGFQTVDPASFNVRATERQHFVYSFGSAHRSVYELAPEGNRAASIWAGGISGVPGNPTYARFVGRWVANQTIPLLLGKEEVKRSGAALQQYVPMPH
jgi:penicillin G amidase